MDFFSEKEYDDSPPEVQPCFLLQKKDNNLDSEECKLEEKCVITEEKVAVKKKTLEHNMQIDVKYMGGKTYTLDILPTDTIGSIKLEIEIETNLPVKDQCIVFAGEVLDDNRTLAEYNIQKDNTLHLYSYCSNREIKNEGTEGMPVDINLNIIVESSTYLITSISIITVKGLKMQISHITKISLEELSLLYEGRILINEDAQISDYNIRDDSDIFVIPASSGGRCLRFMQVIQDTPKIEGFQDLRSSVSFLGEQKINYFLSEAPKKIGTALASDFKNCPLEKILAVTLWTTSFLYKQVNQALRVNRDLSRWSIYLSHLMEGLKYMPYYRGKVYRGIKNYQDKKSYRKGSTVTWLTVSGLSKKKEIACKFSNTAGTIFEVDVVSTRDVSKVSWYVGEDEVILLPHSCLEVIDVIEDPNSPLYIKLREIPIPRSPKVVFWVDDNPEANFKLAQNLEQNGISCVFCTSTQDALKIIETYRWLLYFNQSDFRIVTDMVRYQDGVPNYKAGIDFLKELFERYQYTFQVLIFCRDVIKAKANCVNEKVTGPYEITDQKSKLISFIKFESS